MNLVTYSLGETCKWSMNREPGKRYLYVDIRIAETNGGNEHQVVELPENEARLLCSKMKITD